MALVSRLFSRGISPHCLLFHDAAVGTGASDTDAHMLGQVCRFRASRRPVAPMQRPSVARSGRHSPRLSLTPPPTKGLPNPNPNPNPTPFSSPYLRRVGRACARVLAARLGRGRRRARRGCAAGLFRRAPLVSARGGGGRRGRLRGHTAREGGLRLRGRGDGSQPT